MNDEELKALWQDPKHWTKWSYNCARDPRLVVPKQNPIRGWTINAAHPRAFIILAFCIVASVLPVGFVFAAEGIHFDKNHFAGALFMSLVITVSIAYHFSRKRG